MKWFHEVPASHTGMKSANTSVLGVYIYVNKDMQMYVDIHVLEMVTVSVSALCGRLLLKEFPSVERNNIHILFCQRQPERRTACLGLVQSTRDAGVQPAACRVARSAQVVPGMTWALQLACPRRGQRGGAARQDSAILHPHGIAGKISESSFLQLLGFA